MANRRRPSLGLLALAGVLVLLAFSARYLTAQTLPFPSGGVSSSISSGSSGPPSLFPNGSQTAPSIAYASNPGLGWFRGGLNIMAMAMGGNIALWLPSAGPVIRSNMTYGFAASTTDASQSIMVQLSTPGTAASAVQVNGQCGVGCTGSVIFNRLIATGSSPNCIDNCGAAGASTVVGTDAAWRLTISTANAQSNFAIGFRTAYTGAPNCIAQLAGTGVASVASTNSTATGVTINLTTAPSNGQVYHGQCYGMTTTTTG